MPFQYCTTASIVHLEQLASPAGYLLVTPAIVVRCLKDRLCHSITCRILERWPKACTPSYFEIRISELMIDNGIWLGTSSSPSLFARSMHVKIEELPIYSI